MIKDVCSTPSNNYDRIFAIIVVNINKKPLALLSKRLMLDI